MNSPTDNLPTERFPPNPKSVGARDEGGEEPNAFIGGGFAVLDSRVYRDMRWCIRCGGEEVFIEVYEFEGGRVGVCLGCGDERVIPFSRTMSEVA